MIKTYLVTGGAGFIGSNFIQYILNKYKNDIFVINLDKLTYAGNLNNLKSVEKNKNYVFVKGDICDKKLVANLFKKYNIDYVVNFAAESHVDRSINSAEEFVTTNVYGTFNLLENAKKAWQTGEDCYKAGVKYLQVSTDEVYGALTEKESSFTEKTPICPHSPYSASKAGADMLVKSFYDTHKMPLNITRCSNNYGPYQFPEKLIPLMFIKCKNKQQLPVYGTGLNVRDWLYVTDHCSATDLVLRKAKPGEIYNIGGNNEKNNLYIVNYIINYLSKHFDKTISPDLITFVKDRKGHDFRYSINSSKIQKELGWKPEVSFEKGIELTMNWYLKNDKWIKDVLDGSYKNKTT